MKNNSKILKLGLSLFVPVYNEEIILEQNIFKLIDYLDKLKLNYEIIIGSNGSTDKTCQIGEKLSKNNERVKFFHIDLKGPGLAFRKALKQANFSYFVCQDADLSISLEFIKNAINYLDNLNFDAIVGCKKTGNQKRPFWRILASEFFISCTNFLLKMPYKDYSIGAKAYKTQEILFVLDKNKIDRHTFYTQQILYELVKKSKKIIEIPVDCNDVRKSKFNLLHEGFYRYYKLFKLWLLS